MVAFIWMLPTLQFRTSNGSSTFQSIRANMSSTDMGRFPLCLCCSTLTSGNLSNGDSTGRQTQSICGWVPTKTTSSLLNPIKKYSKTGLKNLAISLADLINNQKRLWMNIESMVIDGQVDKTLTLLLWMLLRLLLAKNRDKFNSCWKIRTIKAPSLLLNTIVFGLWVATEDSRSSEAIQTS